MTDIQLDNLARSKAHDNLTDGVILLPDAVKMLVAMYKEGQSDAPKWVNAIKQMPPDTDDIIFCKWGDERFMSTGRILNASLRRTFQWLDEGGNQ